MTGGEIVQLTPIEAEFMHCLVEAMPQPLDRERIYSKLWGANPIEYPGDSLQVLVCKVRRKIKHTNLHVKTVWGRGYALARV
jgi:DNA-binding response OmpR family regulator